MSPTAEQVKVALEALRKDADQWVASADELATARTRAGYLDLGAVQFSTLGEALGLVALYVTFQERMLTLLGEAETHSRAVAEALRAAANTYEQEEQDQVHTLNGVW